VVLIVLLSMVLLAGGCGYYYGGFGWYGYGCIDGGPFGW
jgi:hypothetical protein